MALTLVVLAAGSGSRFGGLKQLAPIGPSGETLLEYSVFDARQVGFERVVLVVRPDGEASFRERFDGLMARALPVRYCHQSSKDLPPDRSKPWGTAHAVLAAASAIEGPFAVINADDFYGIEALRRVAAFLSGETDPVKLAIALAAFPIASTLGDSGPVSRAICKVDETGALREICELHQVWREDGEIWFRDRGGARESLEAGELVSMNLWGFTPAILPEIERRFRRFLDEPRAGAGAEFLLPDVVQSLVRDRAARVTVLQGGTEWCGITYAEDEARVARWIARRVDEGRFPRALWR